MTAGSLIARLGDWLDRLFPDEARRDRLKETLDGAFAGDDRPVTAELCREIETVAHRFSRHVELEFHSDGGLRADVLLRGGTRVPHPGTVAGDAGRGDGPGAADHVTPVRLTEHVRAVLPEAYVRDAVTGRNWEGAGVVPDLPCDPADALERAHAALTDGSRAAHGAAIRSRR